MGLCSLQCNTWCSAQQYHSASQSPQYLNCFTVTSRSSQDGKPHGCRPCAAMSAIRRAVIFFKRAWCVYLVMCIRTTTSAKHGLERGGIAATDVGTRELSSCTQLPCFQLLRTASPPAWHDYSISPPDHALLSGQGRRRACREQTLHDDVARRNVATHTTPTRRMSDRTRQNLSAREEEAEEDHLTTLHDDVAGRNSQQEEWATGRRWLASRVAGSLRFFTFFFFNPKKSLQKILNFPSHSAQRICAGHGKCARRRAKPRIHEPRERVC